MYVLSICVKASRQLYVLKREICLEVAANLAIYKTQSKRPSSYLRVNPLAPRGPLGRAMLRLPSKNVFKFIFLFPRGSFQMPFHNKIAKQIVTNLKQVSDFLLHDNYLVS